MTRVNTVALAQFLGLAGVATFLPFVIHLQWITGPVVNAILIISLFLLGIRSAMLISLIPSLMALSGGLLPVILAPVVPFIMISNVLFVLAIDNIYARVRQDERGYWSGIAVGAVIKFLFLWLSVDLIQGLLLKESLVMKVAQMMSWTQLATALTGGLLAYAALKWLKRI
jgi:hypothetical protein